MAVPSKMSTLPGGWMGRNWAKKGKTDFLHGLATHNQKLNNKRQTLLGWDMGKGKSKMAAIGSPSNWVTFNSATSGTVVIPTTATGATSTFTNPYYTQQQVTQAHINAINQQMAMQNQAMGSIVGGGSGGNGISQNPQYGGVYGNTPPAFSLTEDQAVNAARGYGHIVLKKAHRVVHTKLMHAWGGLARVNFDAIPPSPLIMREVHGYALPAAMSPAGGPDEYIMPDGSILLIDDYGNYRIEDHDAKVTYKACRVREFNPYINASDLLESFVTEVGKHPLVNQLNVLKLPVEAFVNWLITEAAKRDGDKLEGLPKVEDALKALPAPVAAAA